MVGQLGHWLRGCAVLTLVNVGTVSASAEDLGAFDVVQTTTDRVMAVVDEAPEYVDTDPDRYFGALQEVLDEVVDFSGFSRSVMGPYASKKRYQKLSPEGKKQLRNQVERFTEVMRQGLVRTYGKGLLAFGGSRVEIQRPGSKVEEGKATVKQLIYSDAADPYVIEYQMRRNKKGEWKLRNLIVETVNLGVIYRNQFQAAAKDSGGDLDVVIANWTAPPDAGEG
jgi:phospholipid transport system substrate-binding protein